MNLEHDELKDDMDELHKKLPPDFRPSEKEIEAAYYLFGKRNDIKPDLRILVGTYRQKGKIDESIADRTLPTLRIILNNRLCLFFYGKTGEWLFDGYECGNYEGLWIEFDWIPTKHDAIQKAGSYGYECGDES